MDSKEIIFYIIATLGSIGGFVGGIAAVVTLVRRRNQPSIQEVLETSEDITVLLENKESKEYSQAEKIVQNVERSRKSSFVDKTLANAYRLQRSGRINEALQRWRDLADYAEGNDNNFAARAWFSIGYIHIYLAEIGFSADDLAIRLRLDSPEVYIKPNTIKKAWLSYNKAVRLNPDYAEAYYNRGMKAYLSNYELALEDYDAAIVFGLCRGLLWSGQCEFEFG